MKFWQAILALLGGICLFIGIFIGDYFVFTYLGVALMSIAAFATTYSALRAAQDGEYFIDNDTFAGKKK